MANNDINIKTSLDRTRATGPGPAELPDVTVERRDPIDVNQAMQQLRGLQNMGGYRRGGGYNPTGINQGLRGGHAYVPPPTTYGGGGGFSNSGMPGGGGAPAQRKRYVKPMSGFGGFGGMVATTANDPQAVFAGYMDAQDMPQHVDILGGGGPSPVSQYSPESMAQNQIQAIQQALQPQPQRRPDFYGLGRG